MNYKFKGVYIPSSVWLDDRLSPTQKFLLCEIDAMSNGKNEPCFASNEHFAKHLKCSVGSIRNMIVKLKKLGYILTDFKDKKSHYGRSIWTNLTPSSENDTPSSENDTYINKPLNSLLNKPLNNSLSSERREKNFKKFKEYFLKHKSNKPFFTSDLGWLPDTAFVINDDNYILNTVSKKILTSDDAFKVWKYLFNNQ
jgi:hypothetical protein